MHAKELQRYNRRLVEKRQELLTAGTSAGAVIPAAGRVEGDPVDQANAGAEAELEIQLHRTDGRLLRAIEEALSRINHRGYGVCESCKRPIAKARLEAVPWARHCRDCKEREHSAA
ncbi:MAG: TraR/DksA family transcriptional regulator [Candidatus Acidiferrales bacterium]